MDLRATMVWVEFIDSIYKGGPLPQLVFANSSPAGFDVKKWSCLFGIQRYLLEMLKSTGCYEEIGESIIMAFDLGNHFYEKFYVLRLIPHKHCRDRMIKRGYYKNNNSLTFRNDFERSF